MKKNKKKCFFFFLQYFGHFCEAGDTNPIHSEDISFFKIYKLYIPLTVYVHAVGSTLSVR